MNIKKLILILLILLPTFVYGAIAVPWSATDGTTGIISPNTTNGVKQAVRINSTATSTFVGSVRTGTAGSARDNLLQVDATGRVYPASISAGGAINCEEGSQGQFPCLVIHGTSGSAGTGRMFVINQDGTSVTQDMILASSSGTNVTNMNLKGFPTGKGILKIEHAGSATGQSNGSAISIDNSTDDAQGVFIKIGTGLPINITNSAASKLFQIDSSGNSTTTGYIEVNGSATSTFKGGINLTTGGCIAVGGNCLTSNTGTVTAVSVASSNGFAGSSSGGATPALTLGTTITGLLKGNGTAISAAANGTDYTLITANTCGAGNHVSAITAAGVITCSADTGSGGGSFPFSADTNFGQVVYSTSTPTLWFQSGLFASSTSWMNNLNVSTKLGIATSSPRQALDVNGNVIFNDLAPFQAVTSPMAKAENEEVITAFQVGNGFTYNSGGGSSSADTSDYVIGTQSLKIITDASATQSRVQNLSIPSFSVVGKTILATVKVDKNFTTTDQLFIGFSSDNFTNYFYCPFTYDAFQHYYGGDWFNVSCSQSDYNTTGSPNLSAITAIRLYVRGATGTTHQANFNKISLVPNNTSKKGVVSITFDDGSDGQYTYGLPVLATTTYNFPATAYIETDNIGNGSYMTKSNLDVMQNINNWEIAAHYQTSFASLTYDQQENAIIGTKNWLIKNGYGKGADDFAYPNGEAVSTTTLPLVRKYFTSARMSSDGRHETFPIGNPYALKVFPVKNTTATSTVYAAIDAAAANHDWLILVFHKILPSGATISTEYNQRDLQYITDYLYASRNTVEVKTVNDVINRNDDSIVRLINNNLGVGTSTPGTLLSLGNTGSNTINISPTATSTFGSGLNILTGCYAIGGTCIGGSSFSNTIANGGTGSTSFSPNSIVTSNSDGSALIATTSNLYVSSLIATSTTATSWFGQSLFNGAAPVSGLGTSNSQVVISQNVNNIANQLYLANTNMGVNTTACESFANGNSTNAGASATYIGGICYGGPNFATAGFTGLKPNGLAIYTTDGGMDIGSISSNPASSTLNFYAGNNGGFSGGMADLTLKVSGGAIAGGEPYLGLGTSTPNYKFSVFSSTTPQVSLGDRSGIAQWTMRNAGGNLYFATTTVAGTATTSTSALTLLNSGGINVSASQPATSTSITLDWSATPLQVEYQIGTSATTITVINATTTPFWGSTKRVWVCNPASTAGAITWVGVEWFGATPTQTTTAGACDMYGFNITKATSTTAFKVSGGANLGFQ